VAALPLILKYDPDDILNPSLDSDTVQCRLSVKLEALENEFHIDRILLSKGQVDDGTLLATSFALLSLFTSIWINIDRFPKAKANLGWMVRYHIFQSVLSSWLTPSVVHMLWRTSGRYALQGAAPADL
jgi:hypothetical protein